ncbi:acyl-coenzyme A thioesterase 8-like [Asterias rubens]|uniref:acyl-coenzyme A thioesterase 8-like n=1 Tax=Asterias rubens TaxID=7604 RepID=UPI0014554E6C|nr:acyl-coenzyme A thioesterase 8-like [Asterias rubens]
METSVEIQGTQPSKLIEAVLDLERIDHNLYRANDHWKEFRSKRLYGGQVVSQAMVAASKTVQPQFHIHSLHCYFTRKGNTDIPVLYQVENLRDGKSYATRLVHAIQEGKTILIMVLSFHVREESPFHHQIKMPKVPFPEELPTLNELMNQNHFSRASEKWKAKIQEVEGSGQLLEYRHIDVANILGNKSAKAHRFIWARVLGHLDDSHENIHRCSAAFISDSFIAWTAYMPHKNIRLGQIASLDHNIWFHAPFKADEWMLYELESPKTGAGRGMALGRIWRRDGVLAATIAQEILLRPQLQKPKSQL